MTSYIFLDPQGSADDCSNIEMSPGVPDVSQEDIEISEKKRMAAERRKKIMEQMKSAQRNFMKENAQLFNVIQIFTFKPKNFNFLFYEYFFQESQSAFDAKLSTPPVNAAGAQKIGPQGNRFVCLGPTRSPPMQTDTRHICILCLVDDEVEVGDILLSKVNKSKVNFYYYL
jgi:hypothetical protein